MSRNPVVKVTKLERRPDGSVGPAAQLGEHGLSAQVTGWLRRLADMAKEIFLLEWEGDKIPRGAVVGGHVIAWTQHGLVTSEQGQNVGTYERLMEFGGVSRNEQKMLVFIR